VETRSNGNVHKMRVERTPGRFGPRERLGRVRWNTLPQ